MSDFSSISASISSEWASIRCERRSPPCGRGPTSPVRRHRSIHLIAVDAATPKRFAAERRERPPSTANTTLLLECRGKELSSCRLASFSSPQLESQISTLGNPHYSSCVACPPTYAPITARSLLLKPSGTESRQSAQKQPASSPAHLGRMDTARVSTHASATNCSTGKSFTTCERRRF